MCTKKLPAQKKKKKKKKSQTSDRVTGPQENFQKWLVMWHCRIIMLVNCCACEIWKKTPKRLRNLCETSHFCRRICACRVTSLNRPVNWAAVTETWRKCARIGQPRLFPWFPGKLFWPQNTSKEGMGFRRNFSEVISVNESGFFLRKIQEFYKNDGIRSLQIQLFELIDRATHFCVLLRTYASCNKTVWKNSWRIFKAVCNKKKS